MSKAGKIYKKITPFTYPVKKHIRSEIPPNYSDYRQYRKHLKLEFGGRCVYCRKSDHNQDPGSFHVEHYQPKNKFPALANRYDNLFYACAACNRFKSDFWSDNKATQVLNPCDDVMSHHLVFICESVSKRSARGQFNIELLRLNNDNSIQYRKHINETAKLLVILVLKLKETYTKADQDRINRSITMLSKLTSHSEEKIRSVLRI